MLICLAPNLNLTTMQCWIEVQFKSFRSQLFNLGTGNEVRFGVNVEEAKGPYNSFIYCKTGNVTTKLAERAIPTDLAPVKPPLIVGEESRI